jgi:hypothetical protein
VAPRHRQDRPARREARGSEEPVRRRVVQPGPARHRAGAAAARAARSLDLRRPSGDSGSRSPLRSRPSGFAAVRSADASLLPSTTRASRPACIQADAGVSLAVLACWTAGIAESVAGLTMRVGRRIKARQRKGLAIHGTASDVDVRIVEGATEGARGAVHRGGAAHLEVSYGLACARRGRHARQHATTVGISTARCVLACGANVAKAIAEERRWIASAVAVAKIVVRRVRTTVDLTAGGSDVWLGAFHLSRTPLGEPCPC